MSTGPNYAEVLQGDINLILLFLTVFDLSKLILLYVKIVVYSVFSS